MIDFNSREGHILMAKAAQHMLIKSIKQGLWALAYCDRACRDKHLKAARRLTK